MSGKSAIHFAVVAGSLVVAWALYSLASTFRPDGFLGELQTALGFLFVVPYLLGIVFGGTAHSPGAAGVFLGLFVETYVLALLIWWIARRWR